MKTEFIDVSETRKTLTIEIPADEVDAEINRVVTGYARQAKLPGFRPGKVPKAVIKQRFKEEIRHDVVHGLIPRAVEQALRERGIEPVDTPGITDVTIVEGRPLTFTAAVETVPSFDPGDLSSIALNRPVVHVSEEAVEQTMQQLRERAGKYETVEGRPVTESDAVVAHLSRTDAAGDTDRHENVTIELGAPGNPPGFDQHLIGLSPGDTKHFTVHFPETYPLAELANTDLVYDVELREVRRKVLPELDDEFAKDVGGFETLAVLRDQVRADMEAQATDHARQHVRSDLLKQLSGRVTFDLPAVLVDREMDRRLEEFARQLASQKVDPRQAGIDWAEFRESQREPARASVASALVLDEVARREQLTVAPEDVDKEIERFAAGAGRTPVALRAQLEKEGGISRLHAGLRREKAVDFAMSRARITEVPHEHR